MEEEYRVPLMICLDLHELRVEPSGRVAGYRLRLPDGKPRAVAGLKALNFRVHAAGDSYNDTTMLGEADRGVLFRCPDAVARAFPHFQRTGTYAQLKDALLA